MLVGFFGHFPKRTNLRNRTCSDSGRKVNLNSPSDGGGKGVGFLFRQFLFNRNSICVGSGSNLYRCYFFQLFPYTFNLIPYACLFLRAPGIRNQRRIACWVTSASVQPLKPGADCAVGGGWCVLILDRSLSGVERLDTFDLSKVSPGRGSRSEENCIFLLKSCCCNQNPQK